MTALSKTLVRSLLVLALGSSAIACGDDDGGGGGGGGQDSGPEAGTGDGGGGTGGTGGTDGGPVSTAQCVADAKTTTMGMTSDECLMCACENGVDQVTACDATCWGLIACFAGPCAGVDATDMTAATSCVVGMCSSIPDLLTKGMTSAPAATALGQVLTMQCSSVCMAPSTGDGGTSDGGGTTDTDAGSDTDAGN